MRREQIKEFSLAIFVLIILLTSGILPAAIYAADDDAKNLEYWLNDEEKAFVASIRATDSAVRGISADITWQLWNYTYDKNDSVIASLTALQATLKQFCTISAPEEFQEIGQKYCAVAQPIADYGYKYGLSPSHYNFGEPSMEFLPELVYVLTSTQRNLDALEADLNRLNKELTSKIADVAQRREEAAELLEELFGQCGCFIATAAYGTPAAKEINVLRRFRDEALLINPPGKAFVDFYYEYSPPVAQFISEHQWLRTMVRECLVDPTVNVVEATEQWWNR